MHPHPSEEKNGGKSGEVGRYDIRRERKVESSFPKYQ